MKAVVYTEYGSPDVPQIKEVEKPSPKANEVLIRVHAVSVNFGDLIARNFKNVSPKIVFKRTGTLAQAGKIVRDFCFEKGV